MKICERGLNYVQIINSKGDVRLCCWLKNNVIGSLETHELDEIYHSERANEIRNNLANGNYCDCDIDACPYLAMDDIENHLVDIDEVPQYPEKVYLAFEEVCNYACTSCNNSKKMKENRGKSLEEGYKKIEEKIKPILPYIKHISANGRGELFASSHILNILANWKPLAKPEEVTVDLETNGSLFDEKHWEKISHLGNYNLKVAITVMSFDEKVYQYLSGTKLPISQIENNLRFVKSLREKGIVNYFEIATVYQERNFRELPEFARRCVEEFGADYVRLRPYSPWGAKEPEIEWFTDVRNPLHPYNQEFLDVMKAPIFKHPKVHDWGGGLPSETGDFPCRVEARKTRVIRRILFDESFEKAIINKVNGKRLVVYGMGEVGVIFLNHFCNKLPIAYVIDKNDKKRDFSMNEDFYTMDEVEKADKDVCVIVTPMLFKDDINKMLKDKGYESDQIIHIEDV